MNKRSFIWLIIIGLVAFSSCRKKDLDMTLMQQTLFQDEVIREITADDAWELTIVQDDSVQYVELNYSAFLESYLLARKEGEKLSIGFNQTVRVPSGATFNAVIHLKSLSNLTLSDAVSATLEGEFESPSFVLELNDASTCRGGSFSTNLDAHLSDASKVAEMSFAGVRCRVVLEDASVFKGDIIASERIDIEATDASRLAVYGGITPFATVVLEDASSLNTIPMEITDMQVALKDASEAYVNVTHSITGTLRDASSLYYSGNPDRDLDCDDSSSVTPL